MSSSARIFKGIYMSNGLVRFEIYIFYSPLVFESGHTGSLILCRRITVIQFPD